MAGCDPAMLVELTAHQTWCSRFHFTARAANSFRWRRKHWSGDFPRPGNHTLLVVFLTSTIKMAVRREERRRQSVTTNARCESSPMFVRSKTTSGLHYQRWVKI